MADRFMLLAIKEAEKGITAGDGGPFGSVIVKDGKVIGTGHNMVLVNNDPTCHGEIMAIKDACKNLGTHDLSGCDIYTTAEPCPMCLGAVLWANIRKVYYGCNIKDTDSIGFRDEKFYSLWNDKASDLLSELDRAECLELFKKYNSLDAQRY
ncbi:MAG: nucleoside deaminase [Ruminococcus sp.]|nr:nucleoside deaminase [Ruminococcus sp.]